MHWRVAALGCFVGSLALSASAQQDIPTFRTERTYIEVDAFVTDQRGEFVRGLTKDDFELLEDGRPQEFGDFRLVDLPLHPLRLRASRASAKVRQGVKRARHGQRGGGEPAPSAARNAFSLAR